MIENILKNNRFLYNFHLYSWTALWTWACSSWYQELISLQLLISQLLIVNGKRDISRPCVLRLQLSTKCGRYQRWFIQSFKPRTPNFGKASKRFPNPGKMKFYLRFFFVNSLQWAIFLCVNFENSLLFPSSNFIHFKNFWFTISKECSWCFGLNQFMLNHFSKIYTDSFSLIFKKKTAKLKIFWDLKEFHVVSEKNDCFRKCIKVHCKSKFY